MKARSILIVSLGLNLLLAAWVVAKWRQPKTAPEETPSPATQAAAAPSRLTIARTNVTEVVTNVTDAPGFHWSRVETNDFEAYMANLRAIGCPEHTVRHLVMNEFEELYAKQNKEPQETGTFWETATSRETRERNQQRQREAEEDTKREALHRLLGVEWSAEVEREWVKGEELCMFIGFLSDEKAMRLMEAAKRGERRSRAFRDETQNIVIDTDEPRLDALVEQTKREIFSSLSPAEAEEGILRVISMVQHFTERGGLAGVSLTGDELRRITGMAARGKDLVSMVLRTELDRSNDDDEMLKTVRQVPPEALAEIHTMLGEQRFADYERSKDEAFREFANTASRLELPVNLAVKAYDIRRTAETAVREVKANPALSPEQRRLTLEAMRSETQQAITAAVGAQAAKDFFREDRGWARSAFGAKEAKR